MSQNEAQARIKINHLLEEAGWRFFENAKGPANIQLELHTKIKKEDIDALGDNFESTQGGFLDFLLLDEKGFPLIVLEAKSEEKNPLSAKEQARGYAKSVKCRFVILSNGNSHYFWDTEKGNPEVITRFPEPDSIKGYQKYQPHPEQLIHEKIEKDYIALTQKPDYASDAGWKNESQQKDYIKKNNLKFLRKYQMEAIEKLQTAVKEGKQRFLFEMATGTGKTLTSAAVMKLFLRSGNARRILFLVDRLELEDQASKAFKFLLKNDYETVIYKENRSDWRKAEIVVTTVQSLLFNNKYRDLFSPTDFDLVISDEAHRSIGGNARAVFEYFIGYKLGLTATPKDYLKKVKDGKISEDPRDTERRQLLDTYRTFGCETAEPTFRYSLLDGVRDEFLINPVVVDARTDVTTQLLSDKGFIVEAVDEDGENEKSIYRQRDFEKKFYSDITNQIFCKTFLENGLRDPISNEFGKGIVFAVSQHHASKITQILNVMADKMYPGKYKSDFAIQVTSWVNEAQQYTINFANNNLMGSANFLETYKTSKARICVTVGMMTTGYDCEDILNLALMRPVFSPTDFIQIKGRGTRKHDFLSELHDENLKKEIKESEKSKFKLFDFFANCEYFEEKFDYDEILELPLQGLKPEKPGDPQPINIEYENLEDQVLMVKEEQIGLYGMKIDRMFFKDFENKVKSDEFIKEHVEAGNWQKVFEYLNSEILNKPEEYYTLEKLRKAADVDRKISLREIIEKALGLIPAFKKKDELLEEEFQKFLSDLKPAEADAIRPMKYFFKAYITDARLREIIDDKDFTALTTNPSFTMNEFKQVPSKWRSLIPEYVKDYIPVNQFVV